MLINYGSAITVSVITGILLGLIVGVRYLIRIENHQRKTLKKIEDLQESLGDTEKKILAKLSKLKK